MELIHKYFPDLDKGKYEKFAALKDLYFHWNNQINVISRKDFDHFYERHVLHSLAIARVIQFKAGTKIMDVGTGGGFPGIPLAIMFPESDFKLVDSIGKKIKVVNEIAAALKLTNVQGIHERAEKIPGKFHFIVSRAVTQMSEFLVWVKDKIDQESFNDLPNGILYLKGGDLTEELAPVKKKIRMFDISEFFTEEFFETKKVVFVY